MKKEWIKVNRGLITDPEHRLAMGGAIWLYLYMLDIVDWETATIKEWTDKDAAEIIGMPLSTVRKYRYILEEKYIDCKQGQHSQSIEIRKFKNPRTNEPVQGNTNRLPQSNTSRVLSRVEGTTQGTTQGNTGVVPLLFNSHNHIYTSEEMDNRGMNYQSMFEYFISDCKLTKPDNIDDRKFLEEWDKPMKRILDLFNWDFEKSKKYIDKAVAHADKGKLPISAPKGFVNMISGFVSSDARKINKKPAGTEFDPNEVL